MLEWSVELRGKVAAALTAKGATRPCPRCGNPHFAVLDGFFMQPLQPKLPDLQLGGPSVPSIVVVCTKCGYMAGHALGALGLLPKEDVGHA